MALFGGSSKKLVTALGEQAPDWKRIRALSEGYSSRDRNSPEKPILSALVERAAEADNLPLDDFGSILRNLVAGGVELNAPLGPRGETALHLAVRAGRTQLAESLILAGASSSLAAGGGVTPLHTAAASCNAPLAELLLQNGADVNAEDSEGSTALHAAASRRGNARVVELLIARGATVWSRNNAGETPASLSRSAGEQSYVSMIEKALAEQRTSRLMQWRCPVCGSAMARPAPGRVEWLVALGVWDRLSFNCGRCGKRSEAPELDGER